MKKSTAYAIADETGNPDSFQVDKWPFYWVTQVAGRYVQHLEAGLKRIGLDTPRWRVLMCLHEDAPASVSEIAEHAIAKLPTMTKIIQRMQAEGLVTCAPGDNDARVTEVSLTDAGRVAKQKAWTVASAIYDKVFPGISAKDIKHLNATLENIFDKLDY